MSRMLQDLNSELAGVVENVRRGLVQVHNGRDGSGAGTVWHPDGLILTNAHVIRKGPLSVTLSDGSTQPARLLVQDTGHDLAALAVDSAGLPTISLGESKSLRTGQWVLALGHSWGVVNTVTAGVVIGVGSVWQEAPLSGKEWVAVSLHLRPGYSGGPLVDVDGRVVGINTMMTGPDVGMAVPVHVAKAFLARTLGSQRAAVSA